MTETARTRWPRAPPRRRRNNGRRFDSRERSWQEKYIVASLRRSAIGVAVFRRSVSPESVIGFARNPRSVSSGFGDRIQWNTHLVLPEICIRG